MVLKSSAIPLGELGSTPSDLLNDMWEVQKVKQGSGCCICVC